MPDQPVQSERRRGPGQPAGGRYAARARPSWPLRVSIPLAVLVSFSALFVGVEELERYLAPQLSTGIRHALLTGMAALVTLAISVFVYRVMHRQQRQLADTATQLTRLLEGYQDNPRSTGRFRNPHLVFCGDAADRARPDCPKYTQPGERCWQVLALRHPGSDSPRPQLNIGNCQACAVYRRSCPDELTELGEGINNLLYLLEQGAGQIGKMRDQMLEKQKMAAVGQVAAGVAHEICNPLSSISAVVQMLRRRADASAHDAQFDLIDTHVQRISRVVRQLTTLPQPVADVRQPVDIGCIVAGVVGFLATSSRMQHVRVDFEQPSNLPAIQASAAQLQQMVLHLALNALDAMPSGGTLTLRAAQRDDNLVLTVADTGLGISQAVGRRVFEPFYTTKDPGRGTGLGLTVAYGIAQEHGGTIDFVSQPGAGTTFTVTLPVLHRAQDERHAADQSVACRR